VLEESKEGEKEKKCDSKPEMRLKTSQVTHSDFRVSYSLMHEFKCNKNFRRSASFSKGPFFVYDSLTEDF